ncbi:MAG: outer membrane lipoprotein-sorting protein [Candidatus Hydrogenedentota bacterium]|nr:MAG: outer membrane lipoprotein-sorting protein [Candidatus Hydrogenedentota bacterium]
MKNKIIFLWIVISNLLFAEPSAYQIIRQSENQLRGNTAAAIIEVFVHKKRVQRKMKILFYEDRKKDSSFIKIQYPKKDAGIAFLRIGKNLWQYIPKLGKELKLDASLMQNSWMGTDFTNDDLVKESSWVKDYTHSFLEKSRDSYTILLKPKPTAAVLWKKVIMVIDKKTHLPKKQELYDNKNRLKKVLVFSEVKQMGGRLIPTKFRMATLKNGKEKSYTEMIYKKIIFNKPIPARVFTKTFLRR